MLSRFHVTLLLKALGSETKRTITGLFVFFVPLEKPSATAAIKLVLAVASVCVREMLS